MAQRAALPLAFLFSPPTQHGVAPARRAGLDPPRGVPASYAGESRTRSWGGAQRPILGILAHLSSVDARRALRLLPSPAPCTMAEPQG